VAPPVFKTGLAGNTLAGRFDSFPPPPESFLDSIAPRPFVERAFTMHFIEGRDLTGPRTSSISCCQDQGAAW
jgi:hypothetical protein